MSRSNGPLLLCECDTHLIKSLTYHLLVGGVFGISGVVATYDYIYYTMPSEDAIYKVDFDCADMNNCDPERVLIGVCDRPVDLNYSPITKLV